MSTLHALFVDDQGSLPAAQPPVAEHPDADALEQASHRGPGEGATVADRHWGLIVPADQRDELVAALAPLIALRTEQMGRAPHVLIVEPGTCRAASAVQRWLDVHWRSLRRRRQPMYLLIAGDLDAVPQTVQRIAAREADVGRIAFDTLAEYAAYAEKVVRHHHARSTHLPGARLFCAPTDPATALAESALIDPSEAWLRGEAECFSDVQRVATLDAALRDPHPSVLLTASHGLASPDPGLQGAMVLGADRLTAADVRTGPVLPGGVWFYMACFGGGTPSQSVFAPLLREMFPGQDAAARAIATLAPTPYIAALPKAALANPDGPVAMVAHIDLAWSYGFSLNTIGRRWPAHRRFSDGMAALGVDSGRPRPVVGQVLGQIRTALHRFAGTHTDAVFNRQPALQAESWMAMADLEGYLLLGDPAAEMPVRTP